MTGKRSVIEQCRQPEHPLEDVVAGIGLRRIRCRLLHPLRNALCRDGRRNRRNCSSCLIQPFAAWLGLVACLHGQMSQCGPALAVIRRKRRQPCRKLGSERSLWQLPCWIEQLVDPVGNLSQIFIRSAIVCPVAFARARSDLHENTRQFTVEVLLLRVALDRTQHCWSGQLLIFQRMRLPQPQLQRLTQMLGFKRQFAAQNL